MSTRTIAAAAAALVVAALAGCSASEPPPVDPGSLFSGMDVAQARTACLSDRGWDVSLDAQGAILANYPPEQEAAFEADNLACLEEAGVDADAGLTDEEFTTAYRWYQEIEECLRSHGWDAPERPSEERFRDTYDTAPWIPWEFVDDLERARADCPVMNIPSS
ncbi:hypothetical protein M3147_17835 [Agromyces mediolanus]|uniref:hypothetical protein n=1 Tax=Agromyces mediolanus TaxID=41986 RepID=UPI00203E07AD|nr:hypothetical protein [Agromyces mediolanus]MCM3659119.1 hypothetical protein [Agromyces mediolanus]